MISPAKSSNPTRIRNLGVVDVASDQGVSEESNAAEKALETTKQWVARNPTTAVVASVVLGLLVGYVVKRRNH